MSVKVEFKRVQTDAEVENIDIKDGQLIYTGTGKTFMDYGTERIPTGSGGSSVEVDTEMSDTSENAVQNKVIKEYVDDQIEIGDTEPTSEDNKIWIDTGEVQNSGSELPMVYPVGSIYMSVNNTNPATLFGFGTWEQIKDTFLLSAGDTYSAGTTGGSAKKTIAQNNLPGRTVVQTNVSSNTAVATFTSSSTWNMHCLSDSSSETYGQQLDIMPPYLTVYMWKRTA